MDMPYTGPKVHARLIGEDGNAFAIMSRVTLAMRRQGLPQAIIDEYRQRAMSGDYSHLLAITTEYVEDDDE